MPDAIPGSSGPPVEGSPPPVVVIELGVTSRAVIWPSPHNHRLHHYAEEAKLCQRVTGESTKAIGTAQPVGQRSQQQRLIEMAGALRCR
jgi:hypothetical protein